MDGPLTPTQAPDAPPASREEPARTVRVQDLKRLALWGVAIGLGVVFLRSVGFILLLFVAAASVAALLAPLSRKLPGPRYVTGTLVGVGFFLVVLGAFAFLGYRVQNGFADVREQWTQLEQELNSLLQRLASGFGVEAEITLDQIGDQVLAWLTGVDAGMLAGIASTVGVVVVSLALIVFGAIYFLAGHPEVLELGLLRLAPRHRGRICSAIEHAERRLRLWAVGIACSMTITGVLAGIGFYAVGLPLAIPLAILAGFSELVPTLGPSMVFLLAILIGATEGTHTMALVGIVYLCVQTVESFVLLPLIMKRAVKVPPLVTLFTVVLWGRILGPLGLLLAIPLDLVIWTAVEHFYLEPRRDSIASA